MITTAPESLGLENLMDQMREAILRAEIATAAALAADIEIALAQLCMPLSAGAMTRIKDKAARNMACLDAARRGIRAASRRVNDVRNAAKCVQTYDWKGQRADIALAGPMAARF